MAAAETILFKLAGIAAATIMLSLDLSLRLRREKHLRFARLRRAHVEQREREYEKGDEFDPASHSWFRVQSASLAGLVVIGRTELV